MKAKALAITMILTLCLSMMTVFPTPTGASPGTGDIDNDIKDTLTFAPDNAATPDIIQVSNDIYAVVYRGGIPTRGYLKTIQIAANGSITDPPKDTLEFHDQPIAHPDIIHISGDVYAIAYSVEGGLGVVKTVEIDSNGMIADTAVDSLDFDTIYCRTPELIHVSGNVYAIAYQREDAGEHFGYITTVAIDANGNIGDAIIESQEFSNSVFTPKIIHVSGNIYAIVFRTFLENGYVRTVGISNNGSTIANIDLYKYHDRKATSHNIVHVSGDIYAITYRFDDGTSPNTGGYIRTIEIPSDGYIPDHYHITSAEFDPADLTINAVPIHVSGGVYAISYKGNDEDGFLRTVAINTSDGSILDTEIDILEFEEIGMTTSDITHVTGNIYAIAYCDANAYGVIKTVGIETATPACIDNDGDGYGVGAACTGPDCDDNVASCNHDCDTDADSDGQRDCDDPGIQIWTATGSGNVTFHSSSGMIENLNAVHENELLCSAEGRPNIQFPHGFFEFEITGLSNGQTVTVTITLTQAFPANTQYWKCHDGMWVDITSLVGDNDGDNVFTLTLTDGGLGDDDGVANGVIDDQGGPGSSAQQAPTFPSAYIGILAAIAVGLLAYLFRRRVLGRKAAEI